MKDKLINDLRKVDKYLGEVDQTLVITIVGGSAFILKGGIDRATHDIDSISSIDKKLSGAVLQEIGVDINSAVDNPLMRKFFAGGEQEALESDVKFQNITLYELSDISLIASKFFTKNDDRDITDSSYTGKLNINQDQLEQRILEIGSTFKVNLEKQHLGNRQMEIIEFYKGMGGDYETSRIKELFER